MAVTLEVRAKWHTDLGRRRTGRTPHTVHSKARLLPWKQVADERERNSLSWGARDDEVRERPGDSLRMGQKLASVQTSWEVTRTTWAWK